MRHERTLAGLLMAGLAGCASISSTPTDKPGEGLVYYLPKKDIVVTVVNAVTNGTATTTISIDASAAYPDVEAPYLLKFQRNFIGKNEMKVGVGESGLLTSSKSTTTAGLSRALISLADSAGAMSQWRALSKDPSQGCGVGTHVFVYPAADATHAPCGHRLKITRVGSPKPMEMKARPSEEARTGVFYRQNEPYQVEVVDAPQVAAKIVFSPSGAPVRFLPMARTLFASNEADFTFTDGMPTKYDQNADGELIAALKLPADVVGAYFAAVGRTFDGFKAHDTKEAEALAADLKLELAKRKYDACVRAIQEGKEDVLQQLGCAE